MSFPSPHAALLRLSSLPSTVFSEAVPFKCQHFVFILHGQEASLGFDISALPFSFPGSLCCWARLIPRAGALIKSAAWLLHTAVLCFLSPLLPCASAFVVGVSWVAQGQCP